MHMRKENVTYFISVEGETALWYLEWLQRMINAEPAARYTVKLEDLSLWSVSVILFNVINQKTGVYS